MNCEQKYNASLEQAKKELKTCGSMDCDAARLIFRLFPQLRESEDERIRKEIIAFLKHYHTGEGDSVTYNDDWIAYLEKLKESLHISETCKENIDSFTDKDERIRRGLISFVNNYRHNTDLTTEQAKWCKEAIAYLEKQKEQKPIVIEGILTKRLNENSELYKITGDSKYAGYWAEDKIILEQINWYLRKQSLPNKAKDMIQWTGDNLKEVVNFTGKSPKFGEWFKSWDEFEDYVHSHGDIFKLFCEDGSHYEVPKGAWIVRTPDGYNVASRSKFIQKSAEWSEEDEKMLQRIIRHTESEYQDWCNDKYGHSEIVSDGKRSCLERLDWLKNRLKSLRPSWKPSKKKVKPLKNVPPIESIMI